MVAAAMTALIPGAGPPPTRIASVFMASFMLLVRSIGERGERDPAGDREVTALRREHDHLAGRGRDAGDRTDVEVVRDEHDVAAGDGRARERAHRRGAPRFSLRAGLSAVDRLPVLRAAERELRRFHAAAPPARAHVADGNRLRAERRADPARFGAALLVQIALRRAVVEAHAGWIEDSGGVGVAR